MQTENYIDTYFWETDEPLATGAETMDDYLEYHMPNENELLMVDGTYAEIKDEDGNKFAVHASGNGDFCHHKVEFESM
ncbi:MAG: hypothetical protein J7L96_09550 [Bacteroidales bacterium]|nr:hypothetical protein [Bacteroidales bacterium]